MRIFKFFLSSVVFSITINQPLNNPLWLTKSVFHATFRSQICHRNCCFCMKKAAMTSSSLLLNMSVPYRNRTYNRVLGGPRYIHLTKGTNAVFFRLFRPFGYGNHIYESNHLVMNFYCNLL